MAFVYNLDYRCGLKIENLSTTVLLDGTITNNQIISGDYLSDWFLKI